MLQIDNLKTLKHTKKQKSSQHSLKYIPWVQILEYSSYELDTASTQKELREE